jgi:tRNA(adenine34) deaminase
MPSPHDGASPNSLLDPATWNDAMELALVEADLAARHGDVPVGAVILDADGNVLASGHNRRELDGDATAHAEVVAIRNASRALGHWRLLGCTLVCTLEPCVMCAGALVNARVERLVYGADDPKAGAVHSLYQIVEDPRLNHRLQVVSGVDAAACAARLKAFFASLRAQGQK